MTGEGSRGRGGVPLTEESAERRERHQIGTLAENTSKWKRRD